MDLQTRQRYAQAVAQEKFLRAAAFVVETERLCGINVLPLNLWHVMALDTIGSPFVDRWDRITKDDVWRFLWLLSPKYRDSRLARWWFYHRDVHSLVATKEILMQTAAKILDFVDEAYADAPGVSGKSRVSYYAAAAGLVDLIASAYGWPEKDILRLPLKRSFQYQKAILERMAAEKGVKLPLGNRSDAIKTDYLNRINGN